MLRHRIEQIIKSKPDHPLASLMAGWHADLAPVGMFWRWGNDKNLTWVNYLTTATMKAISSKNLYENLAHDARECGFGCVHAIGMSVSSCIHFMFIFEPK
jgi:predicted solute-binding protein